MRLSIVAASLSFTLAVVGCGGGSTTPKYDFSTTPDFSPAPDMSASQSDMKVVTPYNMPGSVYCYDTPACSSTGANPVCCDAPADGGFADTCVASAAACTTGSTEAHAYQCGQAADCGSGMVCCGTITTSSSSGTMHFTGTACAASCGSGQTQLCVTATECTTSGTSCVGKDISGRDVGLCQ